MPMDKEYKWVNDIYDDSQISNAYVKEAILNKPIGEMSEANLLKRNKILRGNIMGYFSNTENVNNPARDEYMRQWAARQARQAEDYRLMKLGHSLQEPPMSPFEFNLAAQYDQDEGVLSRLAKMFEATRNKTGGVEDIVDWDYYRNRGI